MKPGVWMLLLSMSATIAATPTETLDALKSWKPGENREAVAALEETVRTGFSDPAVRSDFVTALVDFFASDATADAKSLVSLYAVAFADATLREPAAAMLDRPGQLRAGAAILRAIGDEESNAVLAGTLAKSDAARVDALNAMVAPFDDAALMSVAKTLGSAESLEVVRAAATALVRSGDPAAAQTLVEGAARAGSREVREILGDAAVVALRRLADVEETRELAMRQLERLASVENLPAALEGAVFLARFRLDPTEMRTRALEDLTSANESLFRAAVAALQRDPSMGREVVDLLPRLPDDRRIAVASQLTDDPSLVSDLVRMAGSDAGLVPVACAAFSKCGGSAELPALLLLAKSHPREVEGALVNWRAPEAGAHLLSALDADEQSILLIDVLVERRERGVFDRLVKALPSPDSRLHRAAISGVVKLSTPADVPVLLQLLAALPKDEAALTRALERQIATGDPTALAAIREAIAAEQVSDKRWVLLGLLAGSGQDLEMLAGAFPDEPDEWAAWFTAMGKWSGGAEGWKLLVSRAKEQSDPAQRQSAARALADMVEKSPTEPGMRADYLLEAFELAGGDIDTTRHLLAKVTAVPDPRLYQALDRLAEMPELKGEVETARRKLDEALRP